MPRLLALPFVVGHRLLVLASLAVIALSLALLALFLLWPEIAEEITTGRRPTQFYGDFDAELLDDYGAVFGVGHNSGGTVAATEQALRHGADVIEIDVASLDGELVSAHFPPLPLVGHRFFRGPTLDQVWAVAVQTEVVKLDLKESSPAFRELLCAFLAAHRGGHRVLVATGDRATHRALAEREPEAIRLLSVSDRGQLEVLRGEPSLVDLIDGVTIEQTLIDEPTATWLNDRALIALAWTVNDLPRLNELVRLGVDAITTDNLALMELLGDGRRGEAVLVRRPSPTASEEETG